MGNYIKKGIKMMNGNLKTLFVYELLYKFVSIAFFYPSLIIIFRYALKKAGFKYLTNGYIYSFFRSPVTIVMIVGIVLLLMFYNLIEASSLSVCFNESQYKKKISVPELVKLGFSIVKRFDKKENFLILPYILVLTITMNTTVFALTLSSITLPNAVKTALTGNLWINIMYVVLLAAGYYYSISGIFTIDFFVIEKMNYRHARKESQRIVKANLKKIISRIIYWNLAVLLVYYAGMLLMTLIVVAGVKIFSLSSYGLAIYLSCFKLVNSGISFFLVCICVPSMMAIIGRMYNKYRTSAAFPKQVIVARPFYSEQQMVFLKRVVVVLLLSSIAVDAYYVYGSFNKNPFDNVEMMTLPEITSHRGNSIQAPENTISAFEYAIRDMSDYIELDVQETADGELAVIHDASLKRTTGINKKVIEVTMAYIKELDAGSFFSEEFVDEKVPTLEETLEYTKGRIKLNIEIKTSGNNAEILAQKVVELVKEYDMEEECIITSMKYDVLRAVKKIDNSILTGYIISIAYGNFYNMADVDIFSMNYAFVNKQTVDAVHARGRKVHVWTVNSEDRIESLTNMGVDNIITDDPVMAREVIYSRYTNREIVNILNYVFDYQN